MSQSASALLIKYARSDAAVRPSNEQDLFCHVVQITVKLLLTCAVSIWGICGTLSYRDDAS